MENQSEIIEVHSWVPSTVIHTFLAIFFNCVLPFHQVIVAAGLEPDALHSKSYVLPAERILSLSEITTDNGFTKHHQQQKGFTWK